MNEAPETSHESDHQTAREVARRFAEVAGGEVTVTGYTLDCMGCRETGYAVDVVAAAGAPSPELTAWSTVTVHRSANVLDGQDVRVELMVVGRTGDGPSADALARVLVDAAHHVAHDGWTVAPGVVFPGAVAACVEGTTTPHLWWNPPFEFDSLGSFHLEGGPEVYWLQGVPITDAEYQLLVERGNSALEAAMDDVEYTDLYRASIA